MVSIVRPNQAWETGAFKPRNDGQPSGSAGMSSGTASREGSAAQLQHRRRISKQEVVDVFISRLQERGDIDVGAPGFVEAICQHFERLPTRYALDVNTDSLDVLSHKRLLDEARSDPTTVSFAVRPVEVLLHRQRTSSNDGLASPAFVEVRREWDDDCGV